MEQVWNYLAGSQIKDPQGFPKKVYHGTNQPIEWFSMSRRGASTANESSRGGFWFCDCPEVAGEYARLASRATVSDVRVIERETARLQKLIERAERARDWDEAERLVLLLEDNELSALREDDNTGINIVPVYLRIKNPLTIDVNECEQFLALGGNAWALRRAKDGGHDGLVLLNHFDAPETGRLSTHFAVFRPEDIVSAIIGVEPGLHIGRGAKARERSCAAAEPGGPGAGLP